ncbi:FAD-binding oxidoreductase [Nocardia sp. NPDC058244]|uniref:FAD-binding oxidoreductase n=1 Tax=Nocardia sp. NPDC058244 TaxID=3346398 RepID=UPI0036DDA3F7
MLNCQLEAEPRSNRPNTSPETTSACTTPYAASSSLPASIRSGGQGLSGSASNNGGIVIDLGSLNSVTLTDPDSGLVRVGAGARWSQVASALSPHDLVISSGDHGNVGVGGLATAGGIGWLVRTYGLTIDHVRAATVVLPSGEVVRADTTEPDLFWAVRGAGSFVVTDFEIEAMRLPGTRVGQVMIEIDKEGSSLRRWSDFMADAPRELTMSGILTSSGSNLILAMTAVVAEQDPRVAAAVLAPLNEHRGT